MLQQAGVERDHAVLRAGLDVGADLEGLVVADAAADGGRGEHDLERGDSAVHLAVRVELRQEDLRDHGLEAGRELRADLRLLVCGEGVTYCSHQDVLWEEKSEAFWEILKITIQKYKEIGFFITQGINHLIHLHRQLILHQFYL